MLVTRTFTLLSFLALASCVTSTLAQEDEPVALVGAEWLVEDIASRGVIDRAHTTLIFSQEGRLTGNTACNKYFADYRFTESELLVGDAGATKRLCAPAIMDQERQFLTVLHNVRRYEIDDTDALILSANDGTTIVARRSMIDKTVYECADGSSIQVSYPTSDTARIKHEGRTTDMTITPSASGSRYSGEGLEWWAKGRTDGTLSPHSEGESIGSAPGTRCTAR